MAPRAGWFSVILYRYFAKEVFSAMLAVAGIVLVISMGWRFSGYLNEAAQGSITKDILFLVMAYRLPGFLELIVPVSFFLAIMLVYGRLHVDSEMIVLESCGMSPIRLIMMTLSLAAVVMVVTAAITLWLKPAGEEQVDNLFRDQRKLTEFDTLAPGRFQTLRSGKRVTYTEDLDDRGHLSGVFINEYKQSNYYGPKDVITVVADSGSTQVDANGNRFLVLRDGTRYSGQPGEHDYQVIEYEEYGQLIEKERADWRAKRRTGISTRDLIEDPTPRNLSELHWRVSVIFMVPIIAVLAVPLSRVNPRQGRFTRLVPGMIICFLYVVVLSTGRSALEKEQIPVDYGLWWVHVLFIVVAVVLYRLEWLVSRFQQLVYRGAS
ncbi:MAG: LPS export ABC transporter permease LptF [Pseudomonadales bacterium]|nr:LPS export ABC transporter permease LptF [Pseudomonadales bacterium]